MSDSRKYGLRGVRRVGEGEGEEKEGEEPSTVRHEDRRGEERCSGWNGRERSERRDE